jgi:orotidine-5'-phosphate decarboxylase
MLTPARRLIVVADGGQRIVPERLEDTWDRMYRLMDDFANTGVFLQVGPAHKVCGNDLLRKIHANGLTAVVCSSDIPALAALKETLPDIEALGLPPTDYVGQFAQNAAEAGLDGIVIGPEDALGLRLRFNRRLSFNMHAVPMWTSAGHPSDVVTLGAAYRAGADRFIVDLETFRAGSAIAEESLKLTLAEIAQATA